MNKEKKLKIQIGVTIGLTVLLLFGMVAGWAMALVRPQDEKLAAAQAEITKLKGTAGTLQKAKQDLAAAVIQEVHLNSQISFFRERYRSFDFDDWDPSITQPGATEEEKRKFRANEARKVAVWRDYMRDMSYNYAPQLQGEILGAAIASGVQINKLDSIRTGAPPRGPEELTIPANGFLKPTGDAPLAMEISGSLDQILDFFRKIHQGEILKTVGKSLKLEGSSPNVRASFTIQPYLVAKGRYVKVSAAAAPAAAAATGAAGTVAAAASAATTPIGGSGNAAP
jgi:hypothetical protein